MNRKANLGDPVTAAVGLSLVKVLVPLAVTGGLLAYATGYFKNRQEDRNKSEGEKELDTPEGLAAQNLKAEFDKFGKINQQAFINIMSTIEPTKSDKVHYLYQKLTGRRLTDDRAKDVSTATEQRTKKVQQWNASEYATLHVVNNEIVYWVAKGDRIRFTPGSTTPIAVYGEPYHVGREPHKMIQPSRLAYPILQLKEIPIEKIELKERYDLIPIPLPVRTRKVYVMAQININEAGKKPYRVWTDITKWITLKPHAKSVNGLEGTMDSILLNII